MQLRRNNTNENETCNIYPGTRYYWSLTNEGIIFGIPFDCVVTKITSQRFHFFFLFRSPLLVLNGGNAQKNSPAQQDKSCQWLGPVETVRWPYWERSFHPRHDRWDKGKTAVCVGIGVQCNPLLSVGKLDHSECSSSNTACDCLRAIGPGGSRPDSWSGTWRPVGVEPFPYFWSAFRKQVSTVWHSSYRMELQQSSSSLRHPLRLCVLFCSLSQCVSLRDFRIFLETWCQRNP